MKNKSLIWFEPDKTIITARRCWLPIKCTDTKKLLWFKQAYCITDIWHDGWPEYDEYDRKTYWVSRAAYTIRLLKQ